ncbi:MAG: SGNH/GDSL hydrolase family protein [Opitutaceae bacterium]|jgi:lysophospholipase L1-like esterase
MKLLTLLLLCSSLFAFANTQESAFALRDGDRVVFYGDSITSDGGYARFVEAYTRSHYPQWNLRFYNAGVGGDKVSGGWAGNIGVRLERDVIRLKPTVVTIMLGMNDGGYKKFDPATLATYAEGYRALVAKLKEALPGVRLYFIRSTPFDDIARAPNFDPGYNEALRQLSDFVSAFGKEQQVPVVDFGSSLENGIRAVCQENKELAKQVISDRVHPGTAGHFLMGATLLRAWNAPALVARVAIDAKSKTVTAAENTVVSALSVEGGKVTWTELDRSLPLPVNFGENANTQLAHMAKADLESLSVEPLVITGLKSGRYELRIDDTSVGTFTDAELAKGVNLGVCDTPMLWQALRVTWGTDGGHALHRIWRELMAASAENPDYATAAKIIWARDEAAQSTRSQQALPKTRQYSVTPVP